MKRDKWLNITQTHGIGSGIYGVTQKCCYDRPDELKISLKLMNPLIIKDEIEDSIFSQISIWLIRSVENAVNLGKARSLLSKSSGDEYEELEQRIHQYNEDKIILNREKIEVDEMRKQLMPNTIHKSLNSVINSFIGDYSKSSYGDFLKQPINYLMDGCYDGIYNESVSGNTFNRGCILYMEQNPRHQHQAFIKPVHLQSTKKMLFRGTPIQTDNTLPFVHSSSNRSLSSISRTSKGGRNKTRKIKRRIKKNTKRRMRK
jgi:hypothetical protein